MIAMDIDAAFSACVRQPEPNLNLARAALLIACDDYPKLDVELELLRLDGMADVLRERLPGDAKKETALLALNDFLFEEIGFSGNTDDYYDPRNSFLNEVLARRVGIPISLAVIYLEVGWRLRLPLQGVSFPGHFLVKAELERGTAVLDPFFGGRSLSVDELLERLNTVAGQQQQSAHLRHFLVGVGKKDILARMLRNLRTIYLQNDEQEKALTVSNRLLAATPHSARDVRDRGALLEQLECAQAAIHDYQRYLQLAADADDREQVLERIECLQSTMPRLN